MSRKLLVSLLLIAVLFGAFIIGFAIISQRRHGEYFSAPDEQGQNPPQPVTAPILSAYLYEMNDYWTRDSSSDLPICISNIGYSVRNYGNGDAESVEVVIKVDGVTYSELTVSLLRPYEEYSNSFSLTIVYDNSKTVSLYASCVESSDSAVITVNAVLPRYFDSELCRLFITPDEVNVVQIKNQILSNKFPLIPNWVALRDWVGNSITYQYDSNAHGTDEYWQLPKETLQLRTGDCEDFAILLCSLLRADGWSPNDVYVVIGKNNNNEHHAWVKINLGVLGWYNIEPQQNGWSTFIGDFLSLSGYEAIYYFNDSQYHIT
ncbi:MAG: transglutaminase domain-containing protein [Candidatus Bathyarchaeales archaeon]